MAGFLTPTIKFVPSGHILTNQTWSIGLHMACTLAGGDPTQAQLDGVLSDALGAFATWWGNVRTSASSNTQYDGLRLYYYGVGGTKAAGAAQTTITPVVGIGTTGNPAYVAMVASLRSATPGRRGRGRSYLPANGLPTSPTHQWTNAQCVTYATAHAQLLGTLNGLNLTARGISSHSMVISSSSSVGTNYPITRVVCDSLPDTQHRREDKLLPQFTASVSV